MPQYSQNFPLFCPPQAGQAHGPAAAAAEAGTASSCAVGCASAPPRAVSVTCCRRKEQWKSAKAAKAFYQAGANCCSGSEQERYSTIVSKLAAGDRDVDDDVFGY